MKAKLVITHEADMSTMSEEMKAKVRFAKNSAGGKPIAIFPAGTEFEGVHALALCRNGQAAPSDEECANALGLSPAQLDSLQVGYKMDTLGIHKPEDRDLYRAGVISGFDKDGNYKPGVNWDEYNKAKSAVESGDEI
jgi:hypothetical protein